MIRNADIGDIIYLQQGHGSKCKIVHILRVSRYTLYHAKILEPRGQTYLTAKDSVARRAGEFSKIKKCEWVMCNAVNCPNKVEADFDFCELHRS